MYLYVGVALVCAGLLGRATEKRRRERKSLHLQKKPEYVLVINKYEKTDPNLLALIKKRYEIEIEAYEEEEFATAHTKILSKIREKKEEEENKKEENVTYKDICRFAEENKKIFPSLVILCSDVSRFENTAPYLLYSAELLHYRKTFTEDVLCASLVHYSNCTIRNGK